MCVAVFVRYFLLCVGVLVLVFVGDPVGTLWRTCGTKVGLLAMLV